MNTIDLPTLTVDLSRAAAKSAGYFSDKSPAFIAEAEQRYLKFLNLYRLHRGKLVPTKEIDEFWHLHMLRPKAYAEDCRRIVGEIIDHRPAVEMSEADKARMVEEFRRTARLWREEYGEIYSSDEESSCNLACDGCNLACNS